MPWGAELSTLLILLLITTLRIPLTFSMLLETWFRPQQHAFAVLWKIKGKHCFVNHVLTLESKVQI